MKRIVGVTDLTPARWVQDALPDFGKQLVGSIIPGGYEAYVRILHPATDAAGSTWHDIAAVASRALEPLSHWEDISPSDVVQPDEGELELAQFDTLLPLLDEATATPAMCWFALWDGYGDLTGTFAVLLASKDPDEFTSPKSSHRRPSTCRGCRRSRHRVASTTCSAVRSDKRHSSMTRAAGRARGARVRTCGGPTIGRGSSRARST